MQDTFDNFGKPAEAAPPAASPPSPALPQATEGSLRSTPKLNAALALAQGKFTPPAKTKVVDFLDKNGRRVHYKYADLADVIEVIRKPLAETGLSFTARLTYNSRGSYGMRAELRHESGEMIESWYPLPDPAKQQINPKEFGSALTYGRRYSLEALIGVASQEDEEQDNPPSSEPPQGRQQQQATRTPSPGQAAPRTQGTQRQAPAGPAQGSVLPAAGGPRPADQGPPVNDRLVTEAQLTRLFTIASKAGWTNEYIHEYVNTRWRLDSTKELTMRRYDALVAVVQQKTPQQAYATILKEPQI